MSQPVTDPDLLRLLNGDDAPAPRAGPVYGAPAKPETPREPKTTFRTLTPAEVAARGLPPGSYQISSEGKVDKLADAPKNAQTEDQRSQAKQSLMETIDKLDNLAFDALDNGGWGETGLTGSVMSGVPGTAARDLSGMITSVQANTAFDKLQNMKMNSPNGGGLGGNTSDADMALLKSSVANLDQGQSSPAFFGNVAQAKRSYLQMLGRIDPEAAASYAKKKGIRFDEKGNPTLVYVDGEDTREKRYPFGVLPQGGGNDGGTPPPSGGGGGMSQISQGLLQGTGDIVEAGGDMLGLVANPIGQMMYNAIPGNQGEYDTGKILRESFGLPKNENKLASAIIQGGTQALTGAGIARAAGGVLASLATRVVGRPVGTLAEAMPSALQTFGKTPIRDTAAGAVAGAGAVIGEQIGGTPGAIVGALGGGIAGYKAAGSVGARIAGERVPSALQAAADDLDITMLPADVGGVGTRMASGGIGRTLGGIPMAEAAVKSIDSAGAARRNIASSIGEIAADEVGGGQAARRGFKQWEGTSLQRAQKLDEAISVPAESKVQLANTRTALAEVTRGLESNPELSKLWANNPRMRATLEALTPKDNAPQGRADFIKASDDFIQASQAYQQRLGGTFSPQEQAQARQAMESAQARMNEARALAETPPQGGELSWQDMRRFRSTIGEIIGQPGIKRDGPEISSLRKLYGALSSDMEVTAAQNGPKALDEFKKAQRFWRGREGRIDDVFATLFGKDDGKSDEAVFKQINSWAKSGTGDFQRLARTIRSMPKDEGDTVRATIVDRMGNAKPAKGEAETFSPAEFSTQWNGMSNRAKSVLFPDKQHRAALDKFAQVTAGMKRSQEFQNFSNTALGANVIGTGLAALSGPAGWLTAALYSGATFAAGKLLASPRFARMIASTTKLPPEQAGRKFSEQLSVLATREPVLAADARGLQQYITQSLEASPMRAAANEETDSRGKPPQ